MSGYTTQLRWVVEQKLEDMGMECTEKNWQHVWQTLGLADYPIYDEMHRSVLNAMIIRRYWTREIGAETVGRFAWFVRETMHSIMPYYNQLYKAAEKFEELDPLTDWKILEEGDSSGDSRNSSETKGSAQSSDSSNDHSVNVFSDTPQSEMVPAQIERMEYATTVTINDSDSSSSASSSSTAEGSGESDYKNRYGKTEEGYKRPPSELLKLYRENILNIDRMVVEDRELKECFMGVW